MKHVMNEKVKRVMIVVVWVDVRMMRTKEKGS